MSDRSLAKAVTVILLAAVVLGGALSLCIIFGPIWIVGDGSGLTAVDRLKAETTFDPPCCRDSVGSSHLAASLSAR